MQELLGKTLDKTYRIDQLLGKGGMGAVYQAHDVVLDRYAAVKVMHPHFTDDAGVLRARMGFEGVILTDSLGMGAIAGSWGQAQAAVEAVKAGADVVLSTGPLEAQAAIRQALITAAQDGEILWRGLTNPSCASSTNTGCSGKSRAPI